MNNFREMSFVRSLLVALVVFVVLGAGVPGGALARVEIMNGHEGDPLDGSDIVSGGGGDASEGSGEPFTLDHKNPDELLGSYFFQIENLIFEPIFLNGELVWTFQLSYMGGSVK